MFTKVSKLKKFGIFRDFSWGRDTPDFARFNLIYGWNRSGKTIFSRIFSACEKKTTEFEQYPINGEFEIRSNDGTTIKHSDCQNGTKQVRVFNKDFIEDNVSFDPVNPSSPIVYVGEEDIERNKKLNVLREKTTSLSQEFGSAKVAKENSEKAEDIFRISTARAIKEIVGNLKVHDDYRNYDKGSIKTKIEDTGIKNFTELSDEDLEKKKNLIGGEPLKSHTPFSKYDLSFSCDGQDLQNFSDIHEKLSTLLKRQVVAETIDRFKNDPELNKWAQLGFELHKLMMKRKSVCFAKMNFTKVFWSLYQSTSAMIMKNCKTILILSSVN